MSQKTKDMPRNNFCRNSNVDEKAEATEHLHCHHDRLTEDADFGKKKIIFSDEAHFDLGGYVNKQNCRIWDTENPHAYIEKPTRPKRVTVWCEFWSRGINEPFFFENEQGESVTINGDLYRAMLNEFLFTKIEKDNIGNIWFHSYYNRLHFLSYLIIA